MSSLVLKRTGRWTQRIFADGSTGLPFLSIHDARMV